MITRLAKTILRRLGFELRRHTVQSSEAARLQKLLSCNGVDIVLDVGANRGQYAKALRANGYRGKIVSFEPLSGAYAELLNTSRRDVNWVIAPRVALGQKSGELEINVSRNSVSSSAKAMLQSHIDAAPDSRYVGTERVNLARLDKIAIPYLNGVTSAFLKVDTQGFETEILEGAAGILHLIRGIQVELSLVPLYEGQLLFVDMVRKIEDMGFQLFGIIPDFTESATGRLLQADGIFFKKLGAIGKQIVTEMDR